MPEHRPAARRGEAIGDHGFHGIFEKLRQLDIVEQVCDDLYRQVGANFWHDYCGETDEDLVHFTRQLDGPDQRVLDLACGSGRITLALARAGASVDGLELSPAMLALAEQARASEPPGLAARLHFFAGDMAAFTLPGRYDRIVLGATSICLLLAPAQRAGLFRCVRRHLAEGGRFVFNWLCHDEAASSPAEFTDVYARSTPDGQDFAIVGQRRDPASGHYLFNVYRERIAWTGETRRSLAASVKAEVDERELRQHIAAAGLRVAGGWRDGAVHYLSVEPVPGLEPHDDH